MLPKELEETQTNTTIKAHKKHVTNIFIHQHLMVKKPKQAYINKMEALYSHKQKD